MDTRLHRRTLGPMVYSLYQQVTAFILVNWLFLRHSEEESSRYPLYYHEFMLCGFNFFFVLTLITYLKTAVTRAGNAVTMSALAIYCDTCKTDTHERSHHCGLCGQCTLYMKTHCIWVNNCIGLHNLKFLLLLLVYSSVAGAFYSYLMCAYAIGTLAPDYLFSAVLKLVVYFHAASVFMFWLNIVHLLVLHSLLLLNNMSIIDLHYGMKFARVPCLCKDLIPLNDYDMGIVDNVCAAFGTNVLEWWLPTAPCVSQREAEVRKVPDLEEHIAVKIRETESDHEA